MAAASTAQLAPLADQQCQAYFSNTIQVSQVLDWLLEQIGPAHLSISSFSVSEEFLRHIHRLKQKGLIRSASLFADVRAARKTINLFDFIKSVFDDIYLCQNHSKVILLRGDVTDAVVITSQNLTRGDRYECGIISSMPEMTIYISDALAQLANKSSHIDGLLCPNA